MTSAIGRSPSSTPDSSHRSGERLRRVRDHLDGDEYFLANYADVLTDARLDDIVDKFHASGAAVSMMLVPPQQSFHCVEVKDSGEVKDIVPVANFPIWINGGFFVLSQEVFFDYLPPPGGDLVADACEKLAGEGRLFGYRHEGFWKPADTFKERAELDEATATGTGPGHCGSRPMRELMAARVDEIAVVGAHCDDIAIGMGGTLLTLSADKPGLRVHALVLSGAGSEREDEERAALAAFCPGASVRVSVLDIPDGRTPAYWQDVKAALHEFRQSCEPAIVFGPQRHDAHQDHRLLAELLPTEFRDHLILGYEILKWETDTPQPNLFHPLPHGGRREEGPTPG